MSKCTVEAIDNMEKAGLKHQEESDLVADQIASDFCTWLRSLPKGETEDINYTTTDYIRQLFDEQVQQGYIECLLKTHTLKFADNILFILF